MTAPVRQLGRRLPPGADFVTVEELFALDLEERERWEIWTPLSSTGWMSVVRLLTRPIPWGEASLSEAPSGAVLVARERPE